MDEGVLLITLDSCRYDTFVAAQAPRMKSVGKTHRAMAPGNFTYSSHAAMFMGFTPGVASERTPFANPKYGKLLRVRQGGDALTGRDFIVLDGRNVIDGFNRRGYCTIGSGAVGWFDPSTPTGRVLGQDFRHFQYSGGLHHLPRQLEWIDRWLRRVRQPPFVFLNVGETHVPYYFDGAPWDPAMNPCRPFADDNDADECRRRQTRCVEHVDAVLAPLLERFKDGIVMICADHGDCWGEDGLWEHGVHHDKVLEVPLILRVPPR